MSAPLVSIVIPTFNRATFLRQAIDSALSQTHPVEVVVMDNGSTDNTREVVAGYGNRVKAFHRDQNLGPIFNWLEGVLRCSGEWIHLQFDDDWVDPEFVEECVSVVGERTGFVLTGARVHFEGEPERTEVLFGDWVPEKGSYSLKQMEKRVLGSMISPATALYRRQVLIDALYPGALPLEDRYLEGAGPDCFVSLLSMLRYPEVGYVPQVLAHFRAHPGSITIGADPERGERLAHTYAMTKRFYRELKFIRALRHPRLRSAQLAVRRLLRLP